MLTVIKTHQQQMSMGASALPVGRTKKRSHQEGKHIHDIPVSSQHQKGTITKKQPVEYLSTRDLPRRVREKLKYCKKCKNTGHSSKQESLLTSPIEVLTHIWLVASPAVSSKVQRNCPFWPLSCANVISAQGKVW